MALDAGAAASPSIVVGQGDKSGSIKDGGDGGNGGVAGRHCVSVHGDPSNCNNGTSPSRGDDDEPHTHRLPSKRHRCLSGLSGGRIDTVASLPTLLILSSGDENANVLDARFLFLVRSIVALGASTSMALTTTARSAFSAFGALGKCGVPGGIASSVSVSTGGGGEPFPGLRTAMAGRAAGQVGPMMAAECIMI